MPSSLPPAVTNLLQELADIFPQDVPPGLPPIRGIEHQIDLIPGATQEEAFTVLKDKLTHAPLLQLSVFSKTFELECNASGIGLGDVLLQDGRHVAYFSEN